MPLDHTETTYGPKTAQAVRDFLRHADEVTDLLERRHSMPARDADLLAEILTIHLGESARRLGRRFIDDHPDLGLDEVIGARDFAAHGDDIVDHDLLWNAFETMLPTVAAALRGLS